jgi:addiction module RelE/StbE family toxin
LESGVVTLEAFMSKLNISPEARNDLLEIKKYISKDLGSPQAADNTVKKILIHIKNLQHSPEIGPRLSPKVDIETSYRFLVCGNYLAFYRFEENEVFVDRVIYGRRDYIRILYPELSSEKSFEEDDP